MMDEAGVDAAIINPPGWDPGADEMAAVAVAEYPGRFAIVGSILPNESRDPSRISSWRSTNGQLGLRTFFLGAKARNVLEERRADWIWEAAQAADVPVCHHGNTLLGSNRRRSRALPASASHHRSPRGSRRL